MRLRTYLPWWEDLRVRFTEAHPALSPGAQAPGHGDAPAPREAVPGAFSTRRAEPRQGLRNERGAYRGCPVTACQHKRGQSGPVSVYDFDDSPAVGTRSVTGVGGS